MTTNKRQYRTTNVRIEPHKTKEVIAAMTKIWNQHFPSYVFEYNFLDQTIADYYRHEEQLSKLYKIFAGIAIFISCLGLYGLMNFMAVRRRKEIGIRKVLGANVSGIVVNLSKELTVLIVIAFIIAAPIAWYFMSEWLQEYSYRIPMSLSYIIVPFIISIIIAWATISHSAIKAALANPVKSLKS